MIGRLRPAIETKEAERRSSIWQTLDIARDDPKVTHVPMGRAIEIWALQYDMTDLEYRTWRKSAAHCSIESRLVMCRVDRRYTLVRGQRWCAIETMNKIHLKAVRIREPHPEPTAGTFNAVDGGARSLR